MAKYTQQEIFVAGAKAQGWRFIKHMARCECYEIRPGLRVYFGLGGSYREGRTRGESTPMSPTAKKLLRMRGLEALALAAPRAKPGNDAARVDVLEAQVSAGHRPLRSVQ